MRCESEAFFRERRDATRIGADRGWRIGKKEKKGWARGGRREETAHYYYPKCNTVALLSRIRVICVAQRDNRFRDNLRLVRARLFFFIFFPHPREQQSARARELRLSREP